MLSAEVRVGSRSDSKVECYRCGNATPSGLALCQKCGARLPAPTFEAPPAATASSVSRGAVAEVLLRDNAASPPKPSLFAVPIHKFLVMSFCTAGLYQGLWIYLSWARLRQRESKPLSPFWRTVFAAVWNFELFPTLRRLAEAEGVSVRWSPGLLAMLYLAVGALWRLPDPWSWLNLLNLFALLPIVHTISHLPSSRGHFSGYTFGNIVVIVVFGPLVALALYVDLFVADGFEELIELIAT